MNLASIIKVKFRGWFGSRMPIADSVKLNQRSTYILPTRAGYLVMGVTLLMMVGATNYQNNLAFLLTFLLVGIGLVCIVFTFKNLQGIELTLGRMHECFAGDHVPITLRLKSHADQQHFSIAVGFDKKNLYYCDVTESIDAEINLSVSHCKRGYWQLPRMLTSSKFPFGWFNTWAYFRFKSPLLIYPKAIEPPANFDQKDGGDENDEGSKSTGNDDLYGLRPYQVGEPLNRVDWKAYARERGMFIKEFTSYQNQQLCFDWQDFPNCSLEQRLSYLTYMVLDAASQNLTYSLILPNQKFGFDDGENYRTKCLTALALFDEKEG